MEVIRIGIADDHAFFLSAFSQFIDSQADMQIVFTCTDSSNVLGLVNSYAPDVLLLDLSMPGKNGAWVAQDLLRAGSTVPVLFLSIFQNAKAARNLSMLANVSGYLIKHDSPQAILAAIRKAAQGERYLYSLEIAEGIVNLVEDDL
jgi:DNA-binding NarL/FixJ family response regulator